MAFLKKLPDFYRWPFRTLLETAIQSDDLIRFSFGNEVLYLVNHPDIVQHVLKTNQANYVRGRLFDDLYPLIGNGLFSSNETYWPRQRRRINRAFHRRYDNVINKILAEETREMSEGWIGQMGQSGYIDVDIEYEMKRLMLLVLCRTMFSDERNIPVDDLIRWHDTLQQHASIRENVKRQLIRHLPGYKWWRNTSNRRVTDALAAIYSYIFVLMARFIEWKHRPA